MAMKDESQLTLQAPPPTKDPTSLKTHYDSSSLNISNGVTGIPEIHSEEHRPKRNHIHNHGVVEIREEGEEGEEGEVVQGGEVVEMEQSGEVGVDGLKVEGPTTRFVYIF